MSSLATARKRAAPGEPRAAQPPRGITLRPSPDGAAGLGLAAGFALIVFVTTGGTDLGPNTWTEIVLLAIGIGLAVAVILLGAPGRRWGGVTLILFAAVAALTAVSISWSVQPANSWLAANQTLSYLAVFGGAVALARLVPERWPAVVGAIAVLAGVVSAYALLVKVFPGTLDPNNTLGRLRAPFDYWNATGLMAALGLPACLWAGARPERGRAVRALTVPAVAILASVVVLSYSRSALLAAVVGLGCWLAVVPLRLRGVLVLALGLAGASVLTAWALATHPLTDDHVALGLRTSAGHSFGLVLLLVLAALTIVGFAAAYGMDRVDLGPTLRRRIGTALVALVALVPVGGAVALAASSRGLTGEISHLWNTATSQNTVVYDTANRLGAIGSTRSRDWSEGFTVGEHALLGGVGALGYGTARTRYTSDTFRVQHAHSYVVETFADFGLIGVALNLALLVAWGLAAARAVRAPRPAAEDASAAPTDRAAERAGLLTLLCTVLIFGTQSSIDWTWFVPGTALPALFCAGWLAGRGPLATPVGRAPQRRRLSGSAGAAVAGLVAVAVFAAWAVWQPLRSQQAEDAALSAPSTAAAFADLRTAAARDPVAVDPLWGLAALYDGIGDQRSARAELLKAIDLQPDNAQTWLQLGLYDLGHGQPHVAVADLAHAQALDRTLPSIIAALARARAQP